MVADYLCAACVESGAMPEPLTLPTMSKVCPVCAGATLERVWTASNLPSVVRHQPVPRFTRFAPGGDLSKARVVDRVVEPEWQRHHDLKAAAARMEQANREAGQPEAGPRMQPVTAATVPGAKLGKAKRVPMGQTTAPVLSHVVDRMRGIQMANGSMIDRESKLPK